jgi:hypothetical protein
MLLNAVLERQKLFRTNIFLNILEVTRYAFSVSSTLSASVLPMESTDLLRARGY